MTCFFFNCFEFNCHLEAAVKYQSGNDIPTFPLSTSAFSLQSAELSGKRKQTFSQLIFSLFLSILHNIEQFFGLFLLSGKLQLYLNYHLSWFLVRRMFQQVKVSSQIAQITQTNDSNLILCFHVPLTALGWCVQVHRYRSILLSTQDVMEALVKFLWTWAKDKCTVSLGAIGSKVTFFIGS